jgi:hypothetical protein
MFEQVMIHVTRACSRLFQMNSPVDHESIENDSRPKIFFISVVFFYVCYQLAMQPGWVLGGEMWAEMATNYFSNANSPSYWQKLFATDAGYIPAPQRLIALVGNQLNLPAASIPYFYTWSAIICTGLMIGVFCLGQFRALIKSDSLRFLTSISILMVADFETRTFVNFTYFSAFFVAIVTALALTEESTEIPWWAWFAPVLMVSKPAVLAALPAMILVAIFSKSRFRWITIVVVALCVGQLVQMIVSAKTGVMPFRTSEITLVSKLIASIKYFFGFLGGYLVGQQIPVTKYFLMFFGLAAFFVSGFVIFHKKRKSGLLVVGLSLLFFNVLLNSFALSDEWTRDMAKLDGIPVYRHIIVGFFGSILIVSGLFSALTSQRFLESLGFLGKNLGAMLFIVWFIQSDWLLFSGKASREPGFPMVTNSRWQHMAFAIDSGVSPLCVPIDPKGWVYQANCNFLEQNKVWSDNYILINDNLSLDATPPSSISDKTLLAAAILVKPFSTKRSSVEVKMIIKLNDGSVKYYSDARDLNSSGGMMFLTGKDSIAIRNISSVRLMFNLPVEVALTANDSAGVPGIAWMGN